MGSQIAAALQQADEVAQQGDFAAPALTDVDAIDLGAIAEPIHTVACGLLDMRRPAASTFLKLIGPPGTGKSQIARAIAHELWTGVRGRPLASRHGVPFYGFVEISGGPSSDEFLFRYDYVPQQDGTVTMVEAVFVQAMREGWVVMIDEVNTIRDVALLSLNATLDGRLALYLPATGETVLAQPGFAVLLAYNPGLVGASDIPDAWYSRFPATLEVRSNWAALAQLGAPLTLVAAARDLDAQRTGPDNETGLVWTPQFRDIEALWQMMGRVGERTAIALFVSSVCEQLQAGKVQAAEATAVARMLDRAGYAKYRVSATSGLPSLEGYPRAVTS